MSSKTHKVYYSVLYLSKFVVDDELLHAVADSLPSLMSDLWIRNENFRISVIDRVQLVLRDLDEIKLGEGIPMELSKSSKKFVKWFMIVFGVLVNLTSYKRFFVNLIKYRKLDALVTLADLKYLATIASSLSAMVSLIPFIEKLIAKLIPSLKKVALPLASFGTTFASVFVFPESYSKDYLSLYSAAYGLESFLAYVNDKYGLDFQSSWFLVPITFGELFHNYLVHPEFIPKSLKGVFDWLLAGLFEMKPLVLSSVELLPLINNSLLRVKQLTIESSTLEFSNNLLESGNEITRYLIDPSNYMDFFKVITPDNPNLTSVLLNYIPKKFIILSLLLIPGYYLKNLWARYNSEDKTPQSIKDNLLDVIKPATKLSSSVVLSISTAFVLSVLNDTYAKTPLKNLRAIGAVSSIWFFVFLKLKTFNRTFLTYLTRVTFLGTRQKLEKKYGKTVALNFLDPTLAGVGIGLLAGLYSDQKSREYISPNRFIRLLAFMTTN